MGYSGFLSLCSLIYVVAIGRFALSSNWETWHEALPNTQMPKSLVDILQPSAKDILRSDTDDASTFFFTDKDLKPEKRTRLIYPRSKLQAKFLPHNMAESIPFSSEKLPQILSYFSIDPKSSEAKTLKQTIEECEEPGIKGEDQHCATSMKSMIDYAVSKIGNDKEIKIYTTDAIGKESSDAYYYVESVKSIGDKSVVCHKKKYVYAVYLCHKVQAKAYEVSLVGGENNKGARAKAIGVCHADKESLMMAQKLGFNEATKLKPGFSTVTNVCHFLPSDDLVWMPSSN